MLLRLHQNGSTHFALRTHTDFLLVGVLVVEFTRDPAVTTIGSIALEEWDGHYGLRLVCGSLGTMGYHLNHESSLLARVYKYYSWVK